MNTYSKSLEEVINKTFLRKLMESIVSYDERDLFSLQIKDRGFVPLWPAVQR